MGLNCGIVGLPNVGKSTLFSALTSAPAEAANYPFCTIDPNVGVVAVPDPRLNEITRLVQPKKTVPAVVEFVDIAGLVRGASKGEGLGNRFLSHIREVGAIIHVVRCFENPDIIHVENSVDPIRDIDTINLELALADLETVEKRMQKTEKLLRVGSKEAGNNPALQMEALKKIQAALSDGKPARSVSLSDEEREQIDDLHLITFKKQIYACNVDEDGLSGTNAFVATVKELAKKENSQAIVVCAKLESEIAALESDEEKKEFLEAAGLAESGLDQLIHTAYALLGLRTYFTAGPQEVRAWTFHEGDKAPKAAAVIHTDFEKGFIKAEVYHYNDLIQYGSESKVKEAGKYRVEGKEYLVKDGDILFFKFNV